MREGRRRVVVTIVVALLILSLTVPLFLVRCPDRGPGRRLVIWHSFAEGSREDEAIRRTLAAIAAEPPAIVIEVTPMGDQLGVALGSALNTGALPDLLLAPAEWAPILWQAGALHPLPTGAADDWLPAVRAALVRQGGLLGLPVFTATIALGRSDELSAEDWPGDLADLARQAADSRDRLGAEAFWPTADLYYTLPWYLAAGGRLEPEPAPEEDPSWSDPPRVDPAAGQAWLAAVAQLKGLSTADPAIDPITVWGDGGVALAPLIPVEVVALRATGVDVDLGALPGGVPYLSTWALLLPRKAAEPSAAAVELTRRLRRDGDDALAALAGAAGMLPPSPGLFDREAIESLGLGPFRPIAAAALPMPAGLHAPTVWGLFAEALAEFHDGAKADDVLSRLKDGIDQLGPPES